MATDFDNNAVIMAGGIKPSCVDTPTDMRTRVKLLEDIMTIPLPYLGMIVYCEETDCYYKITELGPKDIGNKEIENSLVKAYEEYDIKSISESLNVSLEAIGMLQGETMKLENQISDLNTKMWYLPNEMYFNSKGELVVIINGITKKFAPIPEIDTPVQTNQIDFANNIVFGYYIDKEYHSPKSIGKVDLTNTNTAIVSILPLEKTTEKISFCPETFNKGLIPSDATFFVIIPAIVSLSAKIYEYTDSDNNEHYSSFLEEVEEDPEKALTSLNIPLNVGCNDYTTTIQNVTVKVWGTYRNPNAVSETGFQKAKQMFFIIEYND